MVTIPWNLINGGCSKLHHGHGIRTNTSTVLAERVDSGLQNPTNFPFPKIHKHPNHLTVQIQWRRRQRKSIAGYIHADLDHLSQRYSTDISICSSRRLVDPQDHSRQATNFMKKSKISSHKQTPDAILTMYRNPIQPALHRHKDSIPTCHSHSAAIASAKAGVGTIKGCLAGVFNSRWSSMTENPDPSSAGFMDAAL